MYNQIIGICNSKDKIFDLNVEVTLSDKKVSVSPYYYTSQADWDEVNLYFVEGKNNKLQLAYFQGCRSTVLSYWELLQESEQALQDHINTIPVESSSARKALKRDLPKAVRLAAADLKLDGSVGIKHLVMSR